MPRKPRIQSPTDIYHFINRGVNKKKLFHHDRDYQYYLELLKEYSTRFSIQIHHYCLMNNHTHLLIKADGIGLVSRFGHFVQRRYAYYYCKTYRWSEQVFRKRFISIPIQEDAYLLECGRYIERNPLKAKLVQDPQDYPYSSYSFYSHQKEDLLITPNPLYETMGRNPLERTAAYKFYVGYTREQEKELAAPF